MADTFTIRISKDTPAFGEMGKAAEQLGLSRNQLIIEGMKMMFIGCAVLQKMKQYSNIFKLPAAPVMQNMLIKILAENYQKNKKVDLQSFEDCIRTNINAVCL